MAPQSRPNCVWKLAMTIGVVWDRKAVSSSEKRNSFHEARKAKMAVTAIPPEVTGRTTRHRAPSLLAPSIFAASSSSTGTDSKKLAMSQMESGNEIVTCASARANEVSYSPIDWKICTIGTPTAIGGTMRMTSASTMKTRP